MLTAAKDFGDFVIDGDGGAVAGMGGPAEFTTWPVLEPALRFAAAYSYQSYLAGHFGEVGKLSSPAFRDHALNVADVEAVPLIGGFAPDLGWPARASIRDAFAVAVAEAFDVYGS